jgi:hypothetical protein
MSPRRQQPSPGIPLHPPPPRELQGKCLLAMMALTPQFLTLESDERQSRNEKWREKSDLAEKGL